MKDSFGRDINYLRVSVTKKCNLNCSYCGHKKDSTGNELSADEIGKLVSAFARNGIRKVRLTGGEPLMREDITDIARKIKATDGISALYITTNGILLGGMAKELKKAGVDGVNISLDTLDREKFRLLTGTDKLTQVLEGIESALEEGFSSVKINSVLVRGKNDGEAGALMELARNRPIDVRFIELMPFSEQGYDKGLVVTGAELLAAAPFLMPDTGVAEGAALYYKAEGFTGRIGFINPISHKFCAYCNRVRLLADGRLKLCLGNDLTYDLRPFINDEKRLSEEIMKALTEKPLAHRFDSGEKFRGLNLIGG